MAFIVGFAITVGFLMVEGALDDTADEVDDEDDDDVSVLSVLGWLFFNTHCVDVEFDTMLFGSTSVDMIELMDDEGELSIPSPLWRLIPMGVLTGTGFLFARKTLAVTAGESDGAKRGASVVAGYLPLVFIGSIIFEESFDEGSVGVDMIEALLLAGLVYPIVFGALGGYLAFRTES